MPFIYLFFSVSSLRNFGKSDHLKGVFRSASRACHCRLLGFYFCFSAAVLMANKRFKLYFLHFFFFAHFNYLPYVSKNAFFGSAHSSYITLCAFFITARLLEPNLLLICPKVIFTMLPKQE